MKTTRDVGSGATQSSRLLQVVSRYVPTEVVPHLCFVRLEDRQLRLTVTNAAAATRLRFSGKQVKDGLAKAEGMELDRISVHVKPQEDFIFNQRRTDARPSAVSESTIKLVESAAASAEQKARTETSNSVTDEAAKAGAAAAEISTEEDPLARALKRLALALGSKQ